MAASSSRGWPLFVAVTALAAAADLVSKEWVFSALGMPGESPPVVFVPGIFVIETNLIALGLVVGGIIGNLYDRLGVPGLEWHAPLDRVGQPVLAVRDWIHVTLPGVIDWPIFNLADSWLVIGAGMLLVSSFLETPQPSAQKPQP